MLCKLRLPYFLYATQVPFCVYIINKINTIVVFAPNFWIPVAIPIQAARLVWPDHKQSLDWQTSIKLWWIIQLIKGQFLYFFIKPYFLVYVGRWDWWAIQRRGKALAWEVKEIQKCITSSPLITFQTLFCASGKWRRYLMWNIWVFFTQTV